MKKPSNWYYLLPIIFSIIGGLIMYFVLKDKNKVMARNGLLLGIAITVVTYLLSSVMSALSCATDPIGCVLPFSLLI